MSGKYTFNEFWSMFFDKIFNWDAFVDAFPKIISKIPVSLEITLVSMFFGLVLGLLLALIRINKIPILNQLRAVFVSFMRGTPILVQLLLTNTGIPLILKAINMNYGTAYNINDVSPMFFVILTFSLNEAAFNSETIRAAIQSVDTGQIEAAKSLGMTKLQVFNRVTLPEAATVAVAPLGNSLIGLLKGTSLAFMVGVVEMTAEARILGGSNYRIFETYLALAIVYWVINIIFENIINWIEKKLAIPNPNTKKKHSIFANPFDRGEAHD
jgi:amine acid ABC transporter, permease protein, 3-TM region, His/Glu/Gln/Arg/opine family